MSSFFERYTVQSWDFGEGLPKGTLGKGGGRLVGPGHEAYSLTQTKTKGLYGSSTPAIEGFAPSKFI